MKKYSLGSLCYYLKDLGRIRLEFIRLNGNLWFILWNKKVLTMAGRPWAACLRPLLCPNILIYDAFFVIITFGSCCVPKTLKICFALFNEGKNSFQRKPSRLSRDCEIDLARKRRLFDFISVLDVVRRNLIAETFYMSLFLSKYQHSQKLNHKKIM